MEFWCLNFNSSGGGNTGLLGAEVTVVTVVTPPATSQVDMASAIMVTTMVVTWWSVRLMNVYMKMIMFVQFVKCQINHHQWDLIHQEVWNFTGNFEISLLFTQMKLVLTILKLQLLSKISCQNFSSKTYLCYHT